MLRYIYSLTCSFALLVSISSLLLNEMYRRGSYLRTTRAIVNVYGIAIN